MYKASIVVGITVLLLLSGCSSKSATPGLPHAKAYHDETIDIFKALTFDKYELFQASAKQYKKLYEKSGNIEYIVERFKRLYRLKKIETLLDETEHFIKKYDDEKLVRMHIAALHATGRFNRAIKEAKNLAKSTQSVHDYKLLAGLFTALNRAKQALVYLEKAYAIDFDEATLIDMALLEYLNLDQKDSATARLKAHTKRFGCSVRVCEQLAGLYSDRNNITGHINIYKALFEHTKERKYAYKVVQAYSVSKDYDALIKFLSHSHFDDDLLLRLYVDKKAYKQSLTLSKRLYAKTKAPHYQAQYAIALYLSTSEHNKSTLTTVIDNLTQAVKQTPQAVYLNYLGYLLIDHELDIDKGIEYVNKALSLEASSPFYLDSLAWGYYKKNACHKALEIIKQVKQNMQDVDPEILQHYQKIKQCVKEN